MPGIFDLTPDEERQRAYEATPEFKRRFAKFNEEMDDITTAIILLFFGLLAALILSLWLIYP